MNGKTYATLDDYLAQVRAVMASAGAPPERIADTERGLREHVEEVMAEEGVELGAVLARLDPPTAFADKVDASQPPAAKDRSGLLGAAGFLSGLTAFVSGFVIIPNINPALVETGSKRLIILSVILSLTLGLAGRRSASGKASLLLAAAIVALILIARALKQ